MSGRRADKKGDKWLAINFYWALAVLTPMSSTLERPTMIENHKISLIQYCERSELGYILSGQIAKIKKFKCDILRNFQTLWGLPFLLIHQWTLFPGTLLGIFKRRPRIHTSTLSTWKLLPCFVVQLAKLWVKSWASSIVCSKLMNFFFCWNEDCTLNALYLTWFNFR